MISNDIELHYLAVKKLFDQEESPENTMVILIIGIVLNPSQ